jgi:hypothetical protein
VRACNLFRYYRTIAADDPHLLRAQVAEMDMQEARDLLVRAMQRHRFANRPAVGRWLRWQMIQLAPSFDEADLGFGNFREFLEACSDLVRVNFDERYQELKIELKQQPALLGGAPALEAGPGPEAEKPLVAPAPAEAPATTDRPIITITPSRDREFPRPPESFRAGHQDLHFVEPQTFPSKPEDIRRSDYLRTLWEPRIYIYNREIAAPLIAEIFRINGPGKPMSQYDLEEHLLGGFADAMLANPAFQRFELTQKTVYAVQKLLFWAGAIRFLENDEHVYWKRRKREIRPEFKDAPQLLEAIDVALARQFARHMPLLPEVLATLLQGGDTLDYARKIIARAKEPAPQTDAATPPPEE